MKAWYPKGMPAGERLSWYAQHFEMVEVNSSFYAVPDPRMVERWCRSTPDGFVFNVKLHQLLSRHAAPAKLLPAGLQKMAETDAKGKVVPTPEIEEAVAREILRSVEILRSAGRMGTLLLQLSPAFSPRKHQLAALTPLLEILSEHRVAVEFRNYFPGSARRSGSSAASASAWTGGSVTGELWEEPTATRSTSA